MSKKAPESLEFNIPLAHTYVPSDEDRDKINGWIYSEKFDGNRAYWNGTYRAFYSRDGNNYNMPKEFTKDFPDYDLDGELFMGYGNFNVLSGLLNRKDKSGIDFSTVKYMVFDIPNAPGTFIERMNDDVKFKSDKIIKVPYTYITPETDLEMILSKIVSQGGEGLIIRNPEAKYERKRSKNLLKYVPIYTAEAIVKDIIIGKGKYSDCMGSLEVWPVIKKDNHWVEIREKDKNGKDIDLKFKISGFNDEERIKAVELFIPNKTIITYKYREISKYGIPRFPSFLRIREEI